MSSVGLERVRAELAGSRADLERELASSVQCGTYPFRDPSLFRVAVVLVADADRAEVEAAVDEEIERLATERSTTSFL